MCALLAAAPLTAFACADGETPCPEEINVEAPVYELSIQDDTDSEDSQADIEGGSVTNIANAPASAPIIEKNGTYEIDIENGNFYYFE